MNSFTREIITDFAYNCHEMESSRSAVSCIKLHQAFLVLLQTTVHERVQGRPMKSGIQWILQLVWPRSMDRIVVALLILLLLSVGIPSILIRREQARRLQTDARIRQVGLGLHAYHDTFRSFPVNPNVEQQVVKRSKPVPAKSMRKVPPKPTPATDVISPL